MAPTKIVSFDMDGTITDLSFANSVWLEGVPRLLAAEKGVPLDEARRYAKAEYDKIGQERLEWYDLNHWTKKFELLISTEKVIRSFRHKIRVFPEVCGVIEYLKEKGLKLIIVSNARREFLDVELEETGIEPCFDHVFSSTSDFGLTKKTTDIYHRVCRACGVPPEEIVHIGDDFIFDFEVPRGLGIKAFYLDRTGATSGESVLHNLAELKGRIFFE